MTRRTRAILAALPITLLVTVLTAILLDAVSYLVTLWGERQLELWGVLPGTWDTAHQQLLVLIAAAMVLPGVGFLGYRFFRLAVAAETERLGN